ncbi:RDD family protein [Lacisediminihabitans sp. FW035]
MHRYPWNRLLAWLIDWLCILGWVALIAAIGIPLYLAGTTRGFTFAAENIIAVVVLVVPVTLILAGLESSARAASIGKRVRHLVVVDLRTGQRVSYRRALVRNTIKIALPWTIGHLAVFDIVESTTTGPTPLSVWVLTAFAYALPLAYVASLFLGTGRTPYDRIAGTSVIPAAH